MLKLGLMIVSHRCFRGISMCTGTALLGTCFVAGTVRTL